MPKNILIFSDGTGQAGGLLFDEDRTNIYKLYRATRCGPDTTNDPSTQVCFYDPGLGSASDGGQFSGQLARKLYNLISQATGLGITANIIDCYAALIRLYRDGDRVFLFGFSRGAYTVRCLSGVLAYCGIPRKMPDASPLPMDIAGSRKLAANAVKNVYQFCSSRKSTSGSSYTNFMLETRHRIAERFREEYGSSSGANGANNPNVVPYFIGVFDTVASLAKPALLILLSIAEIALLALAVWAVGWMTIAVPQLLAWFGWSVPAGLPSPQIVQRGFAVVVAIVLILVWLKNYLKFDFRVPGYGVWKSLATVHLARLKHKFEDTTLCDDVIYAKHAISIDEDRRDFARVPWGPSAQRANLPARDPDKNIFFEQVWFSGVHADVGGGYPENESRLSDVTLRWMLAVASIIPNGIQHDDSLLRLFPDPSGPQHDEVKNGGFWSKKLRAIPSPQIILHKSVYRRFVESAVVQYNQTAPYRPENLKDHVDVQPYYTGQGTPTDTCMSDDIEARWPGQPPPKKL